MDSDFKQFMNILADGSVPPAPLVESLNKKQPAFTLPATLRINRGGDSISKDERQRLQQSIALNATDFNALYDLIGRPEADGSPFYPPAKAPETPETISAIDTFLETYGHASDPHEDALLERMILNPTPDYASILEKEAGVIPAASPDDNQAALIDAFLAKDNPLTAELHEIPAEPAIPTIDTPHPKPKARETAASPVETHPVEPIQQPHDDSSLSESLAKIYIRQGKYDKAYEILSRLNLNIPGKSVYFADQLRFLQKLIFLNKHQ